VLPQLILNDEERQPMLRTSRRDFLKTSSAVALGVVATQSRMLHASPFGLPVGLQLFSVRDVAAKDFNGALAMVASLGYQEVEAAGFFDHSAAEVKKALKDNGLTCPSAHYNFQAMSTQTDQIIAYAGELGLKYIVCSTVGFKDPERVKGMTGKQRQTSYTMEDWRWNAEQFNGIGAKVKAAGMDFCYHNHNVEFHPDKDGKVPFDEMLRIADPAKVNFEMDCGWVMVGGGDPVAYLKKYPTRFSMLHVKDFVAKGPGPDGKNPEATEIGRGVMDQRALFKAASRANIKHYFVEQEGFDIPMKDSLRVDAEYMKALKV
jgi:sugar phosphate isomerase/epimerase